MKLRTGGQVFLPSLQARYTLRLFRSSLAKQLTRSCERFAPVTDNFLLANSATHPRADALRSCGVLPARLTPPLPSFVRQLADYGRAGIPFSKTPTTSQPAKLPMSQNISVLRIITFNEGLPSSSFVRVANISFAIHKKYMHGCRTFIYCNDASVP